MSSVLERHFNRAQSKVTVKDGLDAIKSNERVTASYGKDGNTNQPLVMIAHDIKGGLY